MLKIVKNCKDYQSTSLRCAGRNVALRSNPLDALQSMLCKRFLGKTSCTILFAFCISALFFFFLNAFALEGVLKKRTFIMLSEPQCTGSITSSRHPLRLKLICWSFLTNTKPDQAFTSHVHGNI